MLCAVHTCIDEHRKFVTIKGQHIHEKHDRLCLLLQFLDRLKMFTEGSERHRQELAERTRSETQKIIERKLAGEYKLGKETKTIEDALQGEPWLLP